MGSSRGRARPRRFQSGTGSGRGQPSTQVRGLHASLRLHVGLRPACRQLPSGAWMSPRVQGDPVRILRVARGYREQLEKKFSLFHCPSPKGALAPCSGSLAVRVWVSQPPRGPVCRPLFPSTCLPAVSRGRPQAGPSMDHRGEPVSPTRHCSLQRVCRENINEGVDVAIRISWRIQSSKNQ